MSEQESFVPIWVPESEYAEAIQKLYGGSTAEDEINALVEQRKKVPARSREYGRLTATIRRKRQALAPTR